MTPGKLRSVDLAQNIQKLLCRILGMVCIGWVFAILLFVIMGKPDPFQGQASLSFGWKSARRPFEFLLITYAAFLLLHPRRKEHLERTGGILEKWADNRFAIWCLFGLYFSLFTLHSLSNYLALDINFLPFSFYDHMLYYLFQGKIHYTGLALHQFYHTTTVVYLLAPLWYFLKTPLLLVFAHSFLLSVACLPLYCLARRVLKENMLSLVVAFTYLNHRYLLNVLAMDFSELSFYPPIIFSLIYFLIRRNEKAYFLALFLGLLVKEDGPFYFACLGLFLLIFKPGMRRMGLGTALLSLGYGLFIFKVLMPLTGNTIGKGDVHNFPQYIGPDETLGEVIRYLLTHPQTILKELVWPPEKLKTWFKLLSHLLWIPLTTLWFLPVTAALFPCFLQGGIDRNFMQLNFHYSAPTIGFLFVALIFGLSNLSGRFKQIPSRRGFVGCVALGLVALNGGNYYRMRFTPEHLQTMQIVSSLDPQKSVATHGHLFPYLGYRENAFYYSYPLESESHPFRKRYVNSDFFYIDRGVNPYPFSPERVRQKLEELKARADLSLVYEDGKRFLFLRRGSSS